MAAAVQVLPLLDLPDELLLRVAQALNDTSSVGRLQIALETGRFKIAVLAPAVDAALVQHRRRPLTEAEGKLIKSNDKSSELSVWEAYARSEFGQGLRQIAEWELPDGPLRRLADGLYHHGTLIRLAEDDPQYSPRAEADEQVSIISAPGASWQGREIFIVSAHSEPRGLWRRRFGTQT